MSEATFPPDESPAGLYIHVPFCISRCAYCAFVSNLHSRDLEDKYVRALRREIELWSRTVNAGIASCDVTASRGTPAPPSRNSIMSSGLRLPAAGNRKPDGIMEVFGEGSGERPFYKKVLPGLPLKKRNGISIDTIYFGGGTPSVLRPDHIAEAIGLCISGFPVDPSAEISLEINPATVSRAGFADLRAAGVNRVSLGVQSLHDNELAAMGRVHTAREALKSYEELRAAGFDNISLDLIAGFPGQTRESVAATVRGVVELGPEHVSVYLLEVKAGTRLNALIRSGAILSPDDDLAADLYEDVRRQLCQAGYVHYEISNFAREGYCSRHNLKYWQDAIYIGLGPGAHGMDGRRRYANTADLNEYLSMVERGDLPFDTVTTLTPWGRFKDALIMGARLVQGVDLNVLGDRYGIDAVEYGLSTAGDLQGAGVFRLESGVLTLTDRGRLISNTLFSRWV